MTVRELLSRMTAEEFVEWKAFYKVEPFGDYRADLRAGMMTAPLLNIQMAPAHRKWRAHHWVLNTDPPKPQTPEEMKALLQALAGAFGKPSKAPQKSRRAGRRRGRNK